VSFTYTVTDVDGPDTATVDLVIQGETAQAGN